VVCSVCLVYLVCLVQLVSFVQPSTQDRPNRPNRPDRPGLSQMGKPLNFHLATIGFRSLVKKEEARRSGPLFRLDCWLID